MLGSLGKVLLILGAMFLALDHACAALPVRGLYWNIGDRTLEGRAADAWRISELRRLGVGEVHLWLNENGPTPACGRTFHYSQGGGRLWRPERLIEATRSLKNAGFVVIYTLSPEIRTRGYIASLASTGGPLDVAARAGITQIELDIEGNGESHTMCPDGLTAAEADSLLMETIRRTVPNAQTIVSTTRRFAWRHPQLTQSAAAISPQLYDENFATPLSYAQSTLRYFRHQFPGKPLWIALSVECSRRNAERGRCSKKLLESEIKLARQAHAEDPQLFPKYVIWAELEAQPCPSRHLCSVFAQDVLTKPEID